MAISRASSDGRFPLRAGPCPPHHLDGYLQNKIEHLLAPSLIPPHLFREPSRSIPNPRTHLCGCTTFCSVHPSHTQNGSFVLPISFIHCRCSPLSVTRPFIARLFHVWGRLEVYRVCLFDTRWHHDVWFPHLHPYQIIRHLHHHLQKTHHHPLVTYHHHRYLRLHLRRQIPK